MDLIDWNEADRFVSSAYIMLRNRLLEFGRSLVNIIKCKGPSKNPRGTPVVITEISALALLITTYFFLFCR